MWPAICAGILALAVAMGVGRFVYTPILPIMVAELGLLKSEAGLIASVNFVGYMIGALLASTKLLTRFASRRQWVITGLALSCVTSFSMGLMDDQAWFWGLRFLSGLASAFVLVFVSALVIEAVTQRGYPNYATVHFAGVGLGIAASALIVAWLAALGVDWSTQWYWAGGISAAGLALVAWLLPDIDAKSGRRTSGEIDWSLWPLIAAYGLFGFGYVITATFIVAIVRAEPELAPIEPWIWAIAGFAGAPSVALWSWIATKIGLLKGFAAACLVEAFGVALSVLWIDIVGIIVAAIFLGGTFMGITALGLIVVRQAVAGDPSRMIGLMTAFFGIGQIIGPGFAGFMVDWQGSYLWPSLVASGALVLAAGLGLWCQGRVQSQRG